LKKYPKHSEIYPGLLVDAALE